MTTLLKASLIVLAATSLLGCGPMVVPMASRVDEESQKEIDEAWGRIIERAESVERQTLLDVMVLGQLFERGVDRLDFRSEKRHLNGSVIMEVRYDRQRPAVNRFAVSIFDENGQLVRHESYADGEVHETAEDLWGVRTVPVSGDRPLPTDDARRKRMAAIEKLLGDMAKDDQ